MKHKTFLGAAAALSVAALGFGLSSSTHALDLGTSCDGLQSTINGASSGDKVILDNDVVCETSITIPAGSNIYLDLGTSGINANSDTAITVEPNATVYLSGKVASSGANTAVVENHGKIFVGSDTQSTSIINSSNGIAVRNGGEFNVAFEDVKVTGSIQNNGTARLAGGIYNDTAALSAYAASGCSIANKVLADESGFYDRVTCPDVITQWDNNVGGAIVAMPLGYSYNVTYNFPEVAAARNYSIASTDEAVMNVSGDAANGFTITAVAAGDAGLIDDSVVHGSAGMVQVYDIKFNDQSILPNAAIADALTTGNAYNNILNHAISNTLTATLGINAVDASVANIDGDSALKSALGNGSAIGYYEIYYHIMNGGNILADITDLGNETTTISLDLPDNLPAVANGYKRKFFVIHKHLNPATSHYEVSTSPVTIDGETAKFDTSKFSLFILAYIDVEEVNDTDYTVTTTTTAVPDTGSFTSTSSNNSDFNIVCSIVTGILVSFLLFPKIKKLATEK